jgi:hypothetical protein
MSPLGHNDFRPNPTPFMSSEVETPARVAHPSTSLGMNG